MTLSTLNPNTVAALADISYKKVYKEIEEKVIPSRPPHELPLAAGVYMYAMRNLPLSLQQRAAIYQKVNWAIEQNQPIVELEQFIELKVGEVLGKIQDLINRYEDWKTQLATDPKIKGGEPVFPNSRLSVYRIGSLLNRSGANELSSVKEEIVEDYPYLSQEDLIFARIFVSLNPREGRPKKS